MPALSIDKLNDLQKMILYVVRSADDVPINETHLQKMMFQVMKATKHDPKAAGFRPHHFGPYSDPINEGKESLKDLGFLSVDKGMISIEPDAIDEVSTLRLPEITAFRVKMISEYLSKLDNDELLLLTYHDDIEHDDGRYLENSDIKDEVLNKRVTTAIKMYTSGKATLERASELAGMDIRSFEDLLLKSGRLRY